MTDNYEFNRSMHSQSENEYSPYTDKQYNSYINDINSGVYQNDGLSLVQFDLSSIYNSSKFTDTNDLFVVLPIVKGVQEKQGLDIRPVPHGTQALIAWKRRRIVSEVWMTRHGSGSDQQVCLCDSV